MTESVPCVTIVVAAYNAEKTIGRAVKSALAERDVAEVIVVDDASHDSTVEAALRADDGSGRLKLCLQPANKGPSAARNRAVRESTAPWIGVLDADDFFLPGRVSGLLALAGEADLVADDMWQVSEHDIDGPRRGLLDAPPLAPRPVGFGEFVLSNVTRRGRARAELGFIKPLMRREFLAAHGICYQEHMRLGEDFELYARALAHGARMLLVPAQGYVSVVRADSLSGRHSETDLRHLRDSHDAMARELRLDEAGRRVIRQHYRSVDCRLQWRLLISAVKARNLTAAAATFLRPWPVPLYLVRQLTRELVARGAGRAGSHKPPCPAKYNGI